MFGTSGEAVYNTKGCGIAHREEKNSVLVAQATEQLQKFCPLEFLVTVDHMTGGSWWWALQSKLLAQRSLSEIWVLPGGCWGSQSNCTQPRINSKPLCACGMVLGVLQLSQGPSCQTKFQFWLVLRIDVVQLQLLCGVRIKQDPTPCPISSKLGGRVSITPTLGLEVEPCQGPTQHWISKSKAHSNKNKKKLIA